MPRLGMGMDESVGKVCQLRKDHLTNKGLDPQPLCQMQCMFINVKLVMHYCGIVTQLLYTTVPLAFYIEARRRLMWQIIGKTT